MVDWAKVHELRSKGWTWGDIAKDPSVDFHPDVSAGDPGRALRALYHRRGHRAQELLAAEAAPKRVRKEEAERKWTLTRIGYALVPVVGLWFLLAYAAPSPVGLVVPAIPYLALVLAGSAFILIYALWRRTEGPRWNAVYRRTVVGGVVLGLVVAGGIGLTGAIVFGCPYLPPSSSLTSEAAPGWQTGPIAAWQQNGVPVVFFYAATWCPYCMASSWAIYKALTEYGSVTNVPTGYSSTHDVYPGTPGVVLAGAQMGSKNGHAPGLAFQATEDTSGVEGSMAATASCYQQAYVTAYSTGIPFIVLNGQQIHVGALYDPAKLAQWNSANGTASKVMGYVLNETGTPWSIVQVQAWWIMAFIAKDLGTPVATLASEYGWSTSTQGNVTADLQSLS